MSSCTLIDTASIGKYDIYPYVNGISDHVAQVLILHKVKKQEKGYHTYMKWKINKDTVIDFKLQLSHETWEPIFDENDVNNNFNLLLNIFLRIYYSSFPLILYKCIKKNKSWITPGIIKSCKRKREICNELRNNNNPTLRSYYKLYTKILNAVIKKKAKSMEYKKRILNSYNKIKTTSGIITMKWVEIQIGFK
jgi:hypothetical protein